MAINGLVGLEIVIAGWQTPIGMSMNESAGYMRTISGQGGGPISWLARGALTGLSWPYRFAIGVRNGWYDRWSSPRWLDVPVISVGNLTVGGTGKTPMTIWLCRRLADRGLKPAVLSRGYKASEEGLADELLLVSRQCPQAVAVANPDRYAAGSLAVEQYGAQVAVLDDGFQHRRMGRDIDIVLIDATRPFGFGRLLPRGLLREPVHGLARADIVVITRCDQCDQARLRGIEETIARIDPRLAILRAVHQPAGFTDLDGRDTARPQGPRIGCLAGIARPEVFERTLADVDVTPTARRWYPDHYIYSARDVDAIGTWAREEGLDSIVTTEKDAVKLSTLSADWVVPMVALHVEMRMQGEGGPQLEHHIDETLSRFRDMSEESKTAADSNA